MENRQALTQNLQEKKLKQVKKEKFHQFPASTGTSKIEEESNPEDDLAVIIAG